MAKPRRHRSKQSLSQQRADLRRSSPGSPNRIGANEGLREAVRIERDRLAERLEAAEAREQQMRLEIEHEERQDEQRHARMRAIEEERERATQLRPPLLGALVDLVRDSLRLARALATAPLRVLQAMRPRAPREA